MASLFQKSVKEFMNPRVISMLEDGSLKNLFKLMDEHDILGVPVVDAEDHVVGIVTESDLLKHFTTLKTPRSINLLGGIVYLDDIADFNENLKEHCAETVKELMNTSVVTLQEDQTLQDAINRMTENGVNRLPVVNAKNKLVGIITRSDILHELAGLAKSYEL